MEEYVFGVHHLMFVSDKSVSDFIFSRVVSPGGPTSFL